MTVLDCAFEPPHQHEFPDDWKFGGASGTHPGADERYETSVYIYYDAQFNELYRTSMFLCDDEAIDKFTFVAGFGRAFVPVYIAVKRLGEPIQSMMPFKYDKETDLVSEIVRAEA